MDGLPSNADVAERLQMIGDLLEIEGADRHRVTAYRRGASRVRTTPSSVAEMALRGGVEHFVGIKGCCLGESHYGEKTPKVTRPPRRLGLAVTLRVQDIESDLAGILRSAVNGAVRTKWPLVVVDGNESRMQSTR